MSSNASDYSLIQDEDVLKRMWQDTDDFGRKKEIRAHMYKIRETRLKDFYTNTGEESIKTTKTCSDKMTHADSLGDQSFLSLKTKEIRDSESPTRDAYKITGISKKHDQGWDIMETNRSSEDGKHHVSTRLATTSGKKEIQGGEAKYAAKAEQKASVSHEGDDKNYTKSVGNSTSNVIKQEAHGGDENSKFFTSSMTSSSSSQFKSEQKSTSGDLIDDFDQIRKIKENNPINDSNGKTKVYTETKTLPDGSTVTTTRYETVSGSKSYSTSSQKKSESQSHHQTTSSQSQRNESVSVPTQEIVIVKNQYFDDDDQSRRVVGKDLGSQNVKVIRSETKTSTQTKPVSTQEVVITSQKCFDDQKNVESFDDFNTEQSRRRIHDLKTLGRDDLNVKSSTIQKTTEKMITGDDKNVYKVVENFQPEQIIKTTNKIDQYKSTSDDFLQNERRDVIETAQKPLPVEIIPIETKKPLKPEQDFIPHERREPFNPPKSELDEKRSPTDGQYETTYRTDYVSKKISVDINPTHDAFVRSLRSVSPDRNRIPSGRNSRTPSQSSLRSSPEKIRRSPEKSKTRSPEKIISNKKNEKFSSTETFIKTKKSDFDSNTLTRKKKVSRSPSPTTTASEIEFVRSVNDQITDLDTLFKDTKISRRHTENVVVDKRPKTLDTTITTSKKKKVTERSPTSPLMDFSPKKSPTKEVSDDKRKPFRRTDTYEERCKEILGLINKERKDSITSTKVVDDQSRRRSFDKSPEKVIKKSPEKELKSKKEKINEFPSQIRKSPEKEVLGPYPQKSKEIKEPSKISEFPSQIKRSPEKESLEPYPEKRKDLKEPSKIAEFPSQIRKSPNKEPLEPYPEKTKESSKIEPSRISEFPSQVRKSPEKEPLEPYPEKRKESKQAPKVSEFPSQRRQDDTVTITTQETKVSRQDTYDVEPKKGPQKKVPNKKGISEFPSQIAKPIQKELKKDLEETLTVSEFLTETLENRDYVREKSPDRVSLDDLPLLSTDRASRRRTPDRRTPDRRTPDRRTPDRVSLSDLDVRKESELDSFIRNEQFDTEITLKEYEKKQKKVKKDKKIIKEDNGEVETSSSESDEEVERKNDIRETSMPIQMKEIVKMEKVKTTKKVEQKKPIQIKKIQKLETKKPIKETIVTKKNVQALCNDQRMSCNKEKLQFVRGIPDVPHKIVKKDQPEKTLYNKKPEITEKLTKTTKIEAAPKKRVTTTAKVTLTTPKIEVTPKKTTQKINQKIPSSSTKITRTVLQKTIEAVPSNRHVVSTIINLKPKTPTTIHKTTITKTVNSSLPSQPQKIKPKNTETSKMTSKTVPKVNQKKLPLTNGHHVPSDEEETDQEEEIYEKTKKKVAKQEKKCITTKSILIENAVADEREIIVDLKRSKSSREGTPDRICPYPVTIEEFSMPRYPDKITEPEDIKTLPGELKEIINEDVEGFQSKITEIQVESLLNKEKIDIEEDDCMLSVSDKVTKFITTAEELTKPKSSKIDKETKKDYNVDENDESLLSVSEKVSHFIATAEKVKKPEVKTEIKIKAERTPSPEKVIKARSPSPRKEEIIRECQLKREDSFKSTTKKETVRKESLEIETTPKTSRKSSSDEPKIVLSPTGRLRSTETIKKAKALFENINKEQEILVQRDILNRPSVFEGRKNAQPNQIKESKPTPKDFNDDDEEIPHYMTPLDRTIREHSKPKSIKPDDDDEKDNIDSQQEEIDEDIPHYMLPLDRSLRERSPHKENVKQLEDIMTRSTSSTHQVEEIDSRTTKFGVTLRRTDSGRVISTQKIERVNEKQDELNELKIEEIFDLKYLEKLLETIVGYDIRRRIRAQIRIVKKMIEEEKIKSHQNITKTDHLINRRRSTSVEKTKTISSSSFVEKSEQEYTTKKVSSTRRSKSPTEKLRKSPEKGDAKNETKKVFQTELKKTKPLQKIVVDEKPEWVTQKTLKKVSDNTPIKRTTIKKSITNRTEKSPSKEITDVITSSYGVGPLDENGTPLFGLKALRAQNKSDKVKVQGTVIQSQYYSENGQEPIGEVSVTKYSSDPKDLENKEFKTEKGISSITTTQKFGYKGTPSLKTIKNKGVEIEESSKTSKVTRRGSVKEISQKFIENAVETLKSERKSSFPKAGLILRSSSFKDTKSPSPKSGSSRETSPGYAQSTTKTIKTSGTRTETFLTDHSKVTGVQDVITRMKNEDIEGETIEDIEARNLLNKFIGSQVLLSGIESSQDGAKRTVTKITTSVSESGHAPKTITRTFTHPITPELLKTVWDQQTLNLLLEQSSDYEDRKIIRARLREIMAEQEACADLVEKATEDARSSRTSIQERSFTQGPVTTTSQVTSRVTTEQITKKPMSPFAKFRQLDKQNSLNSPPSTPKTPTGSGSFFKFTDPALNQSANTIKQRLLQWCQRKTYGYQNVQLDNFSTSWADGMAFCALIHHFLPEAFDYDALNPKNRRHNFTLAFQTAEDKAGIAPLLDVDDMVAISKPDWKCVFTYVQAIYRRFKDED